MLVQCVYTDVQQSYVVCELRGVPNLNVVFSKAQIMGCYKYLYFSKMICFQGEKNKTRKIAYAP